MLNKEEIKRSLRFSLLDGIFASAMIGFTQEYFAPFLLLLGGRARHIGMLSAFPNFFASLIQLKSADLTDRAKSRKKIINLFVLLQALSLLPIAWLALTGRSSPYYFIMLVVLFTVFGALIVPAWGSLMSDLVPEDRRGKYFGWRFRTLGLVTAGIAFLGGSILQIMKKVNVLHGFLILFGFAFVFRIASWYYLTKMHEPTLEYKKENYFNFFDFVRGMQKRNFARFVLFVSLMNFSVSLVSPFFAVLMLRDMQLSYFLYTLITVTAMLMVYLSIGRWGRHADMFGNLKIIKVVSPLIGLIPILWIINRHPIFLVFVQIFAGFLWAGFNISSTNFIYDAVTPEKRTRCISYFNVFNGLALCSGAIIGGFLLNKLPPLFGYKVLSLCLISSVLRLIIGFSLPVRLKEVRPVQKIKSKKLLISVLGFRPIINISHNE